MKAPSFKTEEEMIELMSWSKRTVTNPETNEDYEDYISQTFYVPFTWVMTTILWYEHSLYIFLFRDIVEEGRWKNYYTNEDIDTSFGVADGDFNGGIIENCAIIVPLWEGWNDWSCTINVAQPIGCGCEHPEQMYLQLRGLCPNSNIDQYYVPRNKKETGSLILIGIILF